MTEQPEPASALDDPRLLFFLEHEVQLRDWAALSSEVFDAVEQTLQRLGLEIAADPRVAGQDVRVGEQVKGETFRAPVLYRDAWCRTAPGIPDVGIALGWDGKVDPAGLWKGASLPYVGVRTAHQTDAGTAIEAAFRARYKADPAVLTRDGATYRKGAYWPVYRHIKSPDAWWTDIPAWRLMIAGALVDAWGHWAVLVDDAVAALG
ncbi:MAG TPA: hypothetical protein VGK16_05490 [Candidatus Limnocylindrales bacterium]|jgi:hypothetical protein